MSTLVGVHSRPVVGGLALVLLAAFALVSCYDDYGLTYSDYDVVVTKYDPATNFAELSTFFMPDSVFHALAEGETDNISRKYDKQILSLVASNFESLGYQRIKDTTATPAPKAVVTVTAAKSTYVYWSYYPYYPYYGWGWGWGYYPGYYPPYYSAGAYQTGTVYVNFSDARDTAQDRLKLVWIGIANGLMGDVSSGTSTRINNSINQMFTQSPYLAIQ